jgi:hypothetical protein
MLLTNSLMRLTLWLLISGGKGLCIASFHYLHIHLLGHGSNGVAKRNSNNFVSLYDLNMTMHASVHAGHGLFMKALR